MKSWPVQDARRVSASCLKTCLREGPQLVTRRGAEAAVLVPMAEWQRLSRERPTLKELPTDWARGDLDIPPRGRLRRRKPRPFR